VDSREASGDDNPCSTCPPGMEYKGKLFTVGDCEWYVDYCYACPLAFFMDVEVLCYRAKSEDTSSTCLDLTPQMKRVLDSIAIADAIEYAENFCLTQYDTCQSGALRHNMRVTTPICYIGENNSKWTCVGGYDSAFTYWLEIQGQWYEFPDTIFVCIDSIYTKMVSYYGCGGDSYCTQFYYLCTEYTPSGPVIRMTYIDNDAVGDISECDGPKPDFEQSPYNNFHIPWVTPCFYYNLQYPCRRP